MTPELGSKILKSGDVGPTGSSTLSLAYYIGIYTKIIRDYYVNSNGLDSALLC